MKDKRLYAVIDDPVLNEDNFNLMFHVHIMVEDETGAEREIWGQQFNYPVGDYPKEKDLKEEVRQVLKHLKAQINQKNKYDRILGRDNAEEETLEDG